VNVRACRAPQRPYLAVRPRCPSRARSAAPGQDLPTTCPHTKRRPIRGASSVDQTAWLIEADARTRTGDPFITSEVLYQLSYVGRRPTLAGSSGSSSRPRGTRIGSLKPNRSLVDNGWRSRGFPRGSLPRLPEARREEEPYLFPSPSPGSPQSLGRAQEPAFSERVPSSAGRGVVIVAAAGSSNRKVEPSPAFDSSQMCPPMRLTSSLQM
jgi:hypothetical protein